MYLNFKYRYRAMVFECEVYVCVCVCVFGGGDLNESLYSICVLRI